MRFEAYKCAGQFVEDVNGLRNGLYLDAFALPSAAFVHVFPRGVGAHERNGFDHGRVAHEVDRVVRPVHHLHIWGYMEE